jgi:hypothetical protein
MFGDTPVILAIIALVILAVGGLVYAALFTSVESEAQVSKRLEAVTGSGWRVRSARRRIPRRADVTSRRR